MTTDTSSKFPIEALLLIIFTLLALCAVLAVVGPDLLAQLARPADAAPPPTSIPAPTRQYSPEIIPIFTDTPDPAHIAIPTWTPTPGLAITLVPTLAATTASSSGPLPDLVVTRISDPVCLPDRAGSIVEFNIYVWNMGRAPTRPFGSLDVAVSLILGQRQYGLDEWAERFNGVVGSSNMQISNLDPGEDVKLTMVIDLKGNTNFGIKAIVNAGANALPEADLTNNTLIKYYSITCY